MKKTAAILLALCIVFSLAACASLKDADFCGLWEHYDEGVQVPSRSFQFNEDLTGEQVLYKGERIERLSFTYTNDGSTVNISFENGSTMTFSYEIEGNNMNIAVGERVLVFVKAQ